MKNLLDLFRKNAGKELLENGIREPLKRSERFLERYDAWKNANAVDAFIFLKNISGEGQEIFPWLTRVSSLQYSGLAFHPHPGLPGFEWPFVMELLQQKLREEEFYVLQRTLREEKLKDGKVFEIQSYYLKPRPQLSEIAGKHEQRFGNILLEYTEINRKFEQFSIKANYYSGFQYNVPLPFEELFA